jgi:multiple sugar transport system substrate-binding protein
MKETSRRQFLAFSGLAVATPLLLSGCSMFGGDSGGGGKTTLRWLVRTNPIMAPWYEKTVAAFEAANPDIKIDTIIVPTNEYDTKLTTMGAGGRPADVFTHWGQSGWADFVHRGLAADLTQYFDGNDYSFDGLTQSLVEQFSVDGKVYGIPFSVAAHAMFYNKGLVQEAGLDLPPVDWNDAGWTAQELERYAQALSKNVSDVANAQYGLMQNMWPQNSVPWLYGGDFFDDGVYTSHVVKSATASMAESVAALDWQRRLIHDLKVSPSPATVANLATGQDPFLSGRVGMVMTGMNMAAAYSQAGFEVGVAAVPQFDTRRVVRFTSPWMMSPITADPDAAWKFISFLSDPKGAAKSYMEYSLNRSPWSAQDEAWSSLVAEKFPAMTADDLVAVGNGAIENSDASINHVAVNYGAFNTVQNNAITPFLNDGGNAETFAVALQDQLTAAIEAAGETTFMNY